MNERTLRIVGWMGAPNESPTLSELAERCGVSERTIRNDVKALNRQLAEKGVDPVRFLSGGKVSLPDGFARAVSSLPVSDTLAYKMSHDERVRLAVAVMLGEAGYVTLASLAKVFSVSRATVMNDLDDIREAVADAGFEFETRPSHGARVLGPESSRRLWLAGFLCGDTPIVEQWFSVPEFACARNAMPDVLDVLNLLCRRHHVTMPDPTFRLAAALLCVSVMRNSVGERLAAPTLGDGTAMLGETSDLMMGVVRMVAQRRGVPMGPEEASLLSIALRPSDWHLDSVGLHDFEAEVVARAIIRRYAWQTGVPLGRDLELFSRLSDYVESVLRAPDLPPVKSPALEAVAATHVEELRHAQRGMGPLEAALGRAATPTEVACVALRLTAAMERRASGLPQPRVLVVCDAEVTTAIALVAELEGRLSANVVDAVPAHDPTAFGRDDVDLIVSTVPLEGVEVPCVDVGMPMSDNDVVVLQRALADVRGRAARGHADTPPAALSADEVVASLGPVLARHGATDAMARDVARAIRIAFCRRDDERGVLPSLGRLLPPDRFRMVAAQDDWRHAVAEACAPLERDGCVAEGYADACVMAVERHAIRQVVGGGMAITHATSEDGVKRCGMSLARLAEPVDFPYGRVDLVVAVAAPDRRTHLRAMATLLDLAADEESLAALRRCADVQTAWSFLSRRDEFE